MRKSVCILFTISCFSLLTQAQPSEFSAPWTDTTKAIVIDAYHGNPIDWELLVTDKRVAAVIHKASQGLKVDGAYAERKKEALRRGLLWGSYHLGVPGDPVKQADFYLEQTGNDPSELRALDIESLDSAKSMTLRDAEKFIARIKEKTGVYPLFYCNKQVLVALNTQYSKTSIFAQCGLWYARFRNDIPDFEQKIWKTYTLWQFSCELNCSKTGQCLYNVPGTDKNMDINVYNGAINALRERWSNLPE